MSLNWQSCLALGEHSAGDGKKPGFQSVLEVRRGSGTYVIGTNRLEDDPLGLSGFTDKYELALDLCNVRLMLEPEIAMLASENATDEERRSKAAV